MTEKKVTIIIGKRGTGKSYLCRQLIAGEKRLFIYDVMGEYDEGVVFDRDTLDKLALHWRVFYRQEFRIVYRPIEDDAEMQMIAELIYALGDVTFVVEEVDTVAETWKIPLMFRYILRRGRHRNIKLIGVTPSPFGIHRDLTRQAKEIYVFDTREPRDREYLRHLISSDIEAKLDQLKQYEYVKWTDDSDELVIGKA